MLPGSGTAWQRVSVPGGLRRSRLARPYVTRCRPSVAGVEGQASPPLEVVRCQRRRPLAATLDRHELAPAAGSLHRLEYLECVVSECAVAPMLSSANGIPEFDNPQPPHLFYRVELELRKQLGEYPPVVIVVHPDTQRRRRTSWGGGGSWFLVDP